MTDTQMKFHQAEAKVTEFILKSPAFEGDQILAKEIGKKMSELFGAIQTLDDKNISQL